MSQVELIADGQSEHRRNCSVDGCQKTVNARGLCSTHYNQWYRRNTGEHLNGRNGEIRHCQRCGKSFYAPRAQIAYVGGGTYCSRACRRSQIKRVCKGCDKDFWAYSSRVKKGEGNYCSHDCRKIVRGICKVEGCSETAWCAEMCQVHYNRDVKARIVYGITLEQHEAMRASGCAICGSHPDDEDYRHRRGLHIDHDHETGAVRAALCADCNNGLGRFGDDPVRLRAAADYIEAHRKDTPDAEGEEVQS